MGKSKPPPPPPEVKPPEPITVEVPEPPPPPPIPLASDEAAQKALAEQRAKTRKRRGYRSTIATSPQGISGPSNRVGSPTLGG